MGGELVSFIVLETPGKSIESGSSLNFSIQWDIHSNYIFFPKVTDAFTRNINSLALNESAKMIVTAKGKLNPLMAQYAPIISLPYWKKKFRNAYEAY